jgi:hypothetical protein
MRNLKLIFLVLTLVGVAFAFNACEPDNIIRIDDELGFAEFNISTPDGEWSTNGRIAANARTAGDECTFDNVKWLVAEIEKNGTVFPTDPVPVYQLGNNVVNVDLNSLKLYTGSYTLNKLYLVDDDNVVLFGVPLADSELADLVVETLPLNFEIIKDEVTTIELEVVCIQGNDVGDPRDFGLLAWEVALIEAANFAVTAGIWDCTEFPPTLNIAVGTEFIVTPQGKEPISLTLTDEIKIRKFLASINKAVKIEVVGHPELDTLVTAENLHYTHDNYGGKFLFLLNDPTACVTPECNLRWVDELIAVDDSEMKVSLANFVTDGGVLKARLIVENPTSSEQKVRLEGPDGNLHWLTLASGTKRWVTVEVDGTWGLSTSDGTPISGAEITFSFDDTTVPVVDNCTPSYSL